jgi:hypothetical protein
MMMPVLMAMSDLSEISVFAVSRRDGRWSASGFCVRELSGRAGIRCVGTIDEPGHGRQDAPRPIAGRSPIRSIESPIGRPLWPVSFGR